MEYTTIEGIIELLWGPVTRELLLACFLGAILGFERELAGKDPGLRTFTLISLGSCVFTMISITSAEGVPNAEPSRIAAQIIPGIGFLGAGAIFRSRKGIAGLTTATMMWVTAGIGMAIGFGRGDLAVTSTILALLVMYLLKLGHKIADWIRPTRDQAAKEHATDSSYE